MHEDAEYDVDYNERYIAENIGGLQHGAEGNTALLAYIERMERRGLASSGAPSARPANDAALQQPLRPGAGAPVGHLA
jgi:hypothetical protein